MRNARLEKHIYLQRNNLAKLLCLLACALLVTRMSYLQIEQYDKFKALSENNRLAIVPMPPARGLILDRHGEVLAENRPGFTLTVVPEQIEDMSATLDRLSKLFELDRDIDRVNKLKKQRRAFAPIAVKMMLTDEEVATFSVQRSEFPGVKLEASLIRYYPKGDLFAHALGYVGRINENELDKLDDNYAGTHYIGKNGVEQAYEDVLIGKVGFQEVEADVLGRPLRVMRTSPSIPGKDLTVSLSAKVQAQTAELLKDKKGAAIAIDVHTGEVITLVSSPSFDPNLFVKGISQKDYDEYLNAGALFNRALKGQYPPASTAKPFVGLGGIAEKIMRPNETFYDDGTYTIKGDKTFRGWKKKGHGATDLKKAIKESSDGYYYNLAHKMGIDKLHYWYSQFNFGQKTGIDIPGELTGLIPSQEWKRRVKNESWYLGETIITGIGQGYCLVTPIQLAYATAILALGGHTDAPHIVRRKDGTFTPLPATEKEIKAVHDAMYAVVNESGGTAFRISQGIKYKLAGKTGTAQVFGLKEDEEYDASKIAKHLHDHSLFIAFAPADNPKYAVSVVLENERGASDLARKVMDSIMEHVHAS